jgi:hypothetical protein
VSADVMAGQTVRLAHRADGRRPIAHVWERCHSTRRVTALRRAICYPGQLGGCSNPQDADFMARLAMTRSRDAGCRGASRPSVGVLLNSSLLGLAVSIDQGGHSFTDEY